MKCNSDKISALFKLAVLAFLFMIAGNNSAAARPAPPLAYIEIAEIWSDGSPQPVFPSFYQNSLPDDIVFTGSKLYIKTIFKGYPKWNTVFYRQGDVDGVLLDYNELGRQGIGAPEFTGWEQIATISFSQLGSINDIAVTAVSTHNVAVECTAIVKNIQYQR